MAEIVPGRRPAKAASVVFKLRLASGLALAVVTIVAIVYLPTPYLAAFLLVLGLLAAREWAKLAGIVTRAAWLAYAIALSGAVALLWIASADWPSVVAWVLTGGAAFWILALGLVVTYPRSRIVLLYKPAMIVAGVGALPAAWLALVQVAKVEQEGPALLIWLLAAAAAADIGAYFAGRRFGRRQLAPQVSPGKTWEGAIGGAMAILAWGVVGAAYFGGMAASLPEWLGLAAVLFVASVTGDLFESAFKRARGVKDSGGLLPGHGGILDRIDSVIATAPVFAVLAPMWLGPH